MRAQLVAPRLDRLGRHDGVEREVAQERREGAGHLDLDAERRHRGDLGDLLEQRAPEHPALAQVVWVLRVEEALERVDDRGCVEACPVVKLDAGPQLEGPSLAVARGRPGRGQPRLDIGGTGLPACEALVEEPPDLDRLRVRDDGGIEALDIRRLGDDERPRIPAQPTGRARGITGRQQGDGGDHDAAHRRPV
jgi:hypothetical protein